MNSSELLKRLRKRALDLSLDLGLRPGHSDYTRFIIGGMGRTGSNLLASSLNSHGDAIVFGELFNKDQTDKLSWGHPEFPSASHLAGVRNDDPLRFLGQHVYRRMPRRIQAVGFKLFYYHPQEKNRELVWSYIESENIKVIHMTRRNLLAMQLSMLRAKMTDQWSTKKSLAKPEDRIHLDYDLCVKGFTRVTRWQRELTERFPDSLLLHYEDLVSDYGSTIGKAQNYLGLEARPTTSPLKKQSSLPLHEAIANYEELEARFRGTEWEPYFKA